MAMPRIGLLVVGHPDYPNQVGLRMAETAMKALKAQGAEFIYGGQVVLRPWEAAAQARQFAAGSVDGVIVFFATWIEAPTAIAAIREVEHLPIAIWGFPMYGPGRSESTGSFVAYAVVKATLERMGQSFVGLAGAVDDEAVLQRAHAFCLAAATKQRLKRARLGLIGYASMGMYSGTFDHALLRSTMGPEVDQVDTYTLVRRAESYTPQAYQGVVAALHQKARITDGVREQQLEKAARLYLALRDLAQERHWEAANVKCQYELSQEYGMTACIPLSLLADEGLVAGCEGDVLTTVTQLVFHYLTGKPIYYGDLLDLYQGSALFSSCGMAPFSLADEEGVEIQDIGFPGFCGVVSSLALCPGDVTYAQLAEKAEGYILNYGTGLGVKTGLRQGRFPALSVQLAGDPERLLASLSGQHFAIAYGDLSRFLEMLVLLLQTSAFKV